VQQKTNEERLMDIIDAVLNTRSDPDQLQVNEEQMLKLQRLHPATLSEWRDETGPLIWVLLIPTTHELMQQFLSARITETQLLDQTDLQQTLDCLYLCSAVALPEIRGKGITKELCLTAIKKIQVDFPITQLFVWPMSEEGRALSQDIAARLNLPLLVKN
jgi:hypothetical protein